MADADAGESESEASTEEGNHPSEPPSPADVPYYSAEYCARRATLDAMHMLTMPVQERDVEREGEEGAALLAEEQPAWSLWLWHETACMSMDVCSDCHRLVAVEAMHTRPTWTEGMRKGCCQPACFVGPCYWCGQPTGAGFECGDRWHRMAHGCCLMRHGRV
jgi:hypothetical protein